MNVLQVAERLQCFIKPLVFVVVYAYFMAADFFFFYATKLQ